jgi:NADH dehydrogenase [ubiquinone] 1 alpha subcomplex assembly factor 7
MNLLHPIIQTAINDAGGAIPLSRFMELALTHPAHGYYTSRDPLGVRGDFTTAPETSQIFGEMIFMWLVQQYWGAGKPKEFALLEMGPGRGTLMQDVLRAAAVEPEFLQAMKLYLLEASPVLREKQLERLSEHSPVYIDDLNNLPAMPLFVVANEFFDALPVEQYRLDNGQWQRKMVVNHESGFAFAAENIDVTAVPDIILKLAPSEWAEYNVISNGIAARLAAHIKQYDGALLAIDYGYEGPAAGDTVQALKHHQYHDALADAGEADITAHVDFKTLAASAAPLRTAIVSQKDFLNSLGARERLLSLSDGKDAAAQEELQAGYDRLTGPEQMGTLFKVLMAVP